MSGPCEHCRLGNHALCGGFGPQCLCIAEHANDLDAIGRTKAGMRMVYPDREQLVQGGWRRPPIRVQATVGKRREPS